MYQPAMDSDVPGIVGIMNRAYRGTGDSAGWSTEAGYLAGDRTTEALLRADIAASPAASLLKWQDDAGGMTGCVWLEPLADDTWYLGSLATDPGQQNTGLGRIMLAAAEEWVFARGAKRVRMMVLNVRETLIAWYVRRGYATTGQTEPFPYGDDRFGIPLRDDLAFVVLEKTL